MTGIWQIQEAKARFSEFVSASLKEGPQVVTRRGVETAVLVPIAEWRRLRSVATPRLKDLLLTAEARTDNLTPPRKAERLRQPPNFE
ncbi:MAG: type II toxin-antitoxin system Phd/YefM family antitoxin [Gammaproteobacteria bacterium]|nr:type II toxin-antitoxin system Phd/YefM family antitoxin [Gammaproteobacteria bacterium]MDE0272376.1 type II toxin-antitoxin system Phd/YefM family antitoxin [Gammaproteobacteria bacterium]